MENQRIKGQWQELKRKATKHLKDELSLLYIAEAKTSLQSERHVQFIQWDQLDLKDFTFQVSQGIPWDVADISFTLNSFLDSAAGIKEENRWQALVIMAQVEWMQRNYEVAHKILENVKVKGVTADTMHLMMMFKTLKGWTLDAMGKRREAFEYFRNEAQDTTSICQGNIPVGKISNEVQRWSECFLFHWAFTSILQE